jgi:predicted phosphodiesterase
MPAKSTRIFSDVHYGDRASGVLAIRQLRGLAEGAESIILNGDTLDTRPGPHPDRTAEQRSEILAFFSGAAGSVTYVTGNHDPDISACHACELAGGEVFVTHGDVVFGDIVPWGRDAGAIRRRLREAWPARAGGTLDEQLSAWRLVAAEIPQRHQSERHPLKYALRFAADTIWPPWKALLILNAWRVQPQRIAALARRHRPSARFAIVGHTHYPGVWILDGVTVINTGSFCGPLGGLAVDVEPGRLTVRTIERVRGEYRTGKTLREFALAGAPSADH